MTCIMIERESSVIRKFIYDYDKHVLTVYFKNGKIYDYSGVGINIFEGLKHTKSIGQFFNEWIKNCYYWSPHPKTRQKFEIGDKVKFINFNLKGTIKMIDNWWCRGRPRKAYRIDTGTEPLVRGFSYQLEKI